MREMYKINPEMFGKVEYFVTHSLARKYSFFILEIRELYKSKNSLYLPNQHQTVAFDTGIFPIQATGLFYPYVIRQNMKKLR